MIKRLIFDLDNTLITWEDTYYEFAVKNVCKDLHLANYSEILNIVITSIDNYEKNYEYFSINNMVTLLNKNANISNYSHITFDKIFVQKLIYYFTFCIPNKADPSVSETLKYLSKKYDLVILTNWFEEPQITRLKKLDILQYFSHVYGTEKIKNKTKPNYNIEEISKENTLRGLFAKEILEEIKNKNYDDEIIENALEIGMEILE